MRRYLSDPLAVAGLAITAMLIVLALAAPLLANGRPFAMCSPDGVWSFPFLRYVFAPDTTETLIEKIFNFLLLYLIPAGVVFYLLRHRKRLRLWILALLAAGLAAPFFAVGERVDKTDYRRLADATGSRAWFAPIPYGPYELADRPYAAPSRTHIFGSDQVGRDVASRLLYGSRVSLAVGLGATVLAMAVGTAVGLWSGYFGGVADLAVMRLGEVVICFPTFLLLLILMSLFQDWDFRQSILIVIGVIGLTGWIGVCQLVRGETLRQRNLAYVQSCVAAGVPHRRILFVHLLPNIAAPILVAFTFSVAGAILAESTLSFLGFGVRPPTASWGGLLRQAYENPFEYWHLTLIPGLALFLAVCGFNFTGEGLRRMLDPKA
ncbi:MAG: ABC transporter permease [Victivallaceae bacterium]